MIIIFRQAISLLSVFTIMTGFIYSVAIAGISQLAFPFQANGSLIRHDHQVVGSALIGQPFDDPKYFWGRPSATGTHAYNAGASSGSNLGPTNPALQDAVRTRIETLRSADSSQMSAVPIDLVTASGSGLDPHMSLAAAYFQVPRISHARNISESQLKELIRSNAEGRFLGILGESYVNVLQLNLALDQM